MSDVERPRRAARRRIDADGRHAQPAPDGTSGRAERITVEPVTLREGDRWRVRRHYERRTTDENLDGPALAAFLREAIGGALSPGAPPGTRRRLAGPLRPRRTARPPPAADAATGGEPPRPARSATSCPRGSPSRSSWSSASRPPDGRVRSQRRAKFRQVNRFVELVEDVVPRLPEGRCGSSTSGRDARTSRSRSTTSSSAVHGRRGRSPRARRQARRRGRVRSARTTPGRGRAVVRGRRHRRGRPRRRRSRRQPPRLRHRDGRGARPRRARAAPASSSPCRAASTSCSASSTTTC